MSVKQYISSHLEEMFKIYFALSYIHSIIDIFIILNYGCMSNEIILYMFILTLYPYFLLLTAYMKSHMSTLIVCYHVYFGLYGVISIFYKYSILVLHDLNIQYFLYRSIYMLVSSYFIYVFDIVMRENEELNKDKIIDLKDVI